MCCLGSQVLQPPGQPMWILSINALPQYCLLNLIPLKVVPLNIVPPSPNIVPLNIVTPLNSVPVDHAAWPLFVPNTQIMHPYLCSNEWSPWQHISIWPLILQALICCLVMLLGVDWLGRYLHNNGESIHDSATISPPLTNPGKSLTQWQSPPPKVSPLNMMRTLILTCFPSRTWVGEARRILMTQQYLLRVVTFIMLLPPPCKDERCWSDLI